MGNKLCAPWRKGYSDEQHPWTPKKDSHLLRLWAEIFEVREEPNDISWARVSDDVVPVNITCIQDNPETVFQITAYNRHVEKIFDVRLIQPGTQVTQASECFVHWKDCRRDHEWGLNFTTPVDARRFRDCCMRVKGRKAASNPTSPISAPRRAVSHPEELALREVAEGPMPGEVHHPHDNHFDSVEAIATIPRGRQAREIPHAQTVFENNRASSGSVYDNVATLRRSMRAEGRPPPHPNMNKPIGEREIPYNEYHQVSNPVYETTYNPQAAAPQEPIYQQRPTLNRENLENILYGSQERILDENAANYEEELKRSKQELRQFSREPTVLKLSNHAGDQPDGDYDNYVINAVQADDEQIIKLKHPEISQTRTVTIRTAPERRRLLHKSHSSSSPEWPAPPTPHSTSLADDNSPPTPGLPTKFDSNTLKKMLRSLPDGSPLSIDNEKVFDYNDNVNYTGTRSAGSSPVKTSGNGSIPTGYKTLELSRPPKGGRSTKPRGIPLQTDIGITPVRDSYPDSGISGMTNDTTGSVKSGDSERSGRSGRSGKGGSLPPGLGLSGLGKSSTAGSSVGSSSGRNSDLIRQSGAGSETTEVRQLTSSDISESESETSSEAGTSDSSIHTMPSESQASFASKSAAVRKAGWLVVKNWLIHKRKKIELAPKRQWKKYWVCLKGTVLLFYACDDNETVTEDSVPRHMLVIEGGIAQAVPEHPKREFIFALSTAFGDGYLFQAPSQIELENWINGIHSACASSFARQHGKDNTLKLLRSEIQKLENSIDLDIKMKKMASLQLTTVKDPKSKQAIEKQIAQWDENLEKLYIEQYRLRCYMASLQGSELPNPKTLLSAVSKATKATLSRVGVFTVTSFHGLVCARTPLSTAALYSKKQKRGLLSTFKADSQSKLRPRSPKPFNPQAPTYKSTDVNDHVVVDLAKAEDDIHTNIDPALFGDNIVRVSMPGGQVVGFGITEKTTVQDVLELACNRRQLNPNNHFIRMKVPGQEAFKIPDKEGLMQSEEFESLEVCRKILFQIELTFGEKDKDFGFNVEAELAEDTETEDELCVFISDVQKGGLAHRKGLQVGDEILVMNSKVVSELDMVYCENMLQEETSLTLTVRSCRTERPMSTTAVMEHADIYIENMMCPPPPSQSRISDKVIEELVVPAPNWVQVDKSDDEGAGEQQTVHNLSKLSSEQIDNLLQGAEQVTHFCRLLHNPLPENMQDEEYQQVKPLSESQRLRKVIMELIETERHYVKDLNCMIERYLEPLKEETFLSGEELEQLFGNIQEIVQFQHLFLQSLEEAVELEPNFSILNQPRQFRDEDLRRILFSVGGSFLYYANHFKLYSSFCASHSKAQKLLNPENNIPLQEFLRARNPKQQHSATLESYLIKPIQRILKYPLLLRQLKELTDPQSDEHYHLVEALRGMEAVAEHINEMQKIYEEYGVIFDDLIRQYKEDNPQVRPLDLNVGELQMYGNVNWLNALLELGKIKKGTELMTILFVFKNGLVILAMERIKGKKKQKPQPVNRQNGQEGADIIRFQVAIPVHQLEVRSVVNDTSERHGLWELIHRRSEKEGRPEKIYQFASSHEAKRDFLKTIHSTIRESVRRMTVPTARGHPKSSRPPSSPPSGADYIPYPHSAANRQDSLQSNGQSPGGAPRSLGKKKGKQLKQDMVRHSMDIDDSVNIMDQSAGSDFRIRSRTLTDLNNADVIDSNGGYHNYPSGSQSTLASETSRTGACAKLIQSSNNPVNFSNQNISQPRDGSGSPVWKPRHYSRPPQPQQQHPQYERGGYRVMEERQPPDGVVGYHRPPNREHFVYDDRNSAVVLTPPNAAYVEYEDTDC